MNKKVLIGIIVAGVVIVGGIAAYVLRPTAEATAPIEAIPVEVEDTEAEAVEEVVEDPAEEVMEEKTEDEAGDSMDEEMVEESSDEMASEDGMITFVIDQSQSAVRFVLDELLRGDPVTVIGATDQVAGEIAIDRENPANSKVGVILVNARTLETDNGFRNRAINNEILETDEFEFITFTPAAITGWPENPQVGEEFSLQIVGELTIRDITHEVTFEMTVSAVSETQIQGFGSTLVARADYDLRIPSVPQVANVDEEVLIEIEFVANAK